MVLQAQQCECRVASVRTEGSSVGEVMFLRFTAQLLFYVKRAYATHIRYGNVGEHTLGVNIDDGLYTHCFNVHRVY